MKRNKYQSLLREVGYIFFLFTIPAQAFHFSDVYYFFNGLRRAYRAIAASLTDRDSLFQ